MPIEINSAPAVAIRKAAYDVSGKLNWQHSQVSNAQKKTREAEVILKAAQKDEAMEIQKYEALSAEFKSHEQAFLALTGEKMPHE